MGDSTTEAGCLRLRRAKGPHNPRPAQKRRSATYNPGIKKNRALCWPLPSTAARVAAPVGRCTQRKEVCRLWGSELWCVSYGGGGGAVGGCGGGRGGESGRVLLRHPPAGHPCTGCVRCPAAPWHPGSQDPREYSHSTY